MFPWHSAWKKDFTVETEVKDFSGEVSVEKNLPTNNGRRKEKKKKKKEKTSAIALALGGK